MRGRRRRRERGRRRRREGEKEEEGGGEGGGGRGREEEGKVNLGDHPSSANTIHPRLPNTFSHSCGLQSCNARPSPRHP